MCQPLVTALHFAWTPSGQSCSCAPSLAPCSGQASFSSLWSGETAPACPSPWQGGSLLLRKGLHHCCCSTRTAALQIRLCWEPLRPQPCIGKEMGRKSGSSLCWTNRAEGPPYQPCLQGSPPHGEYLHHHALGTITWVLRQTGPVQAASSTGWKMGVMKHGCISLPCSHTCSNGCCHLKAASLVLAATGLSPRRVAGAEVELGSRQQ